MTQIRVLIVDDEPLARRGVRQLLGPYSDFTVVGECGDGRDAVQALDALQPDVVFLDVQMPGLNGLGVIRAHGVDRMPLVIFVTAHDEFAVKAFEAQALDYLIKPLGAARFRTAIGRVREQIRLKSALDLAGRLTSLLKGERGQRSGLDGGDPSGGAVGRRISVPTDDGELLLDPEEIDWIEADDYYVGIHAGSHRYRLRESLATLESRLDRTAFVRIHRSAMVRLDRIRQLTAEASGDGEASVVLRDGTRLPVSRRRLGPLRGVLKARR